MTTNNIRSTPYPDAATLNDCSRQHRTVWQNRTMVWREWGEGSPIILLHGGFGSWTHWIRNIPALSAHHRVLVPDMLSFGESDDLPDGHPIEMMTKALMNGVESLIQPIEKINIVGFSFGTLPASTLARAIREKHSVLQGQLVLTAPAGLGLSVGRLSQLQSIRTSESDSETREIIRQNLNTMMIDDPSKITEETIDLQIANVARKRLTAKPVSRSELLIKTCNNLQLDNINIIYGTKDVYKMRTEPAYSKALVKVHPGLVIHEIEGAGHWAQYENPKAFNAIVQRCLSDA